MNTNIFPDTLSATLFGKTRRAVLSLLYTHADESFYLREITRSAGAGLGAVQRELQSLYRAGIVTRAVSGRQVYYKANTQCPVFSELKALILKTAGAGDVLKTALAPLADRITIAFIYGSVAAGTENRESDIDLMVVGRATFAEIVAVVQKAQQVLGREVNPSVYPEAEFKAKLASDNHFLTSVVKTTLLFLIGGKRELARLAKKRLAD
ncbi:MAG: nucleotidyltransferase domain-containing protein [Deltaproteobacteria bacterium]|nr:nucleotidyltransferase domain-containing protein [Deltaproteobacteria bacterium]